MKGVLGHLLVDCSMIGAPAGWSVPGDSSVVGSSADSSFVVSTVTDGFVDWASVDGASVDGASVEELSVDDVVSEDRAFVDEASEDWSAVESSSLSGLNLDSWVLNFQKSLLPN